MKTRIVGSAFAFALALLASTASAQVPHEMTVQGILYDTAGMPVSGPTSFAFSLTRGGTSLWTETQTVTLTGGLFAIALGSTTPIDPAYFTMARVSLTVAVQGETMDPIPLTAVPYAFRAVTADTAEAYTGDVAWGQVTGAPSGIADGVDDVGPTYSSGAGLTLSGTQFAADFGGNGAAGTVAHSDHTHDWGTLTSVPPGFADGVDDTGGVPSWSSIVGTPPGFADGTDDVGDAWGGLTGVPAGFADGVDNNSTGVIFTHWGRSDCPGTTTRLYAGYTAGGSYDQSGSGANVLCLIANPVDPAAFSDLNQNGALVYGAEYEMNGYGLAGAAPFNTLQNGNIPCAVCLDAGASVQLMQPGSTVCPAGFNTRVQGYLMAEHFTHARESEYLCIDAAATTNETGVPYPNNDGSLWYPVEAECGSLPCGAGLYHQDREISCAVCTL